MNRQLINAQQLASMSNLRMVFPDEPEFNWEDYYYYNKNPLRLGPRGPIRTGLVYGTVAGCPQIVRGCESEE